MDYLKEKPFYLKDEDITWVKNSLNEMTEEEKIGQLFCLIAYDSEDSTLENLMKYKPGGVMARPMPLDITIAAVKSLQEKSRIPMLIAANLEKGGTGVVKEGTFFGSPMQVAATNNEDEAYRLGVICGREGAAAGVNWSFSPIIDIDYNFRNPITNTRTFGSEPERVKKMGLEYVKGVQENGVAASIKHFPGDGLDERDQHLVTTINDLSCDEWDETYGDIYKACIDAGAMTVMVGHIMQPAYSKKLAPDMKDGDILPASLSYELVTKLLKEQLGFKGLVVTDATTMAGMIIPMTREQAVPLSIAAGCDMFLFTRSLDEDYGYMKKGVEDGVITQERLNEALTKILALKASLGLHKKQENGTLIPSVEEAQKVILNPEHKEWARNCADQSTTLVKCEAGVLPLSAQKYKKVLFYDIESSEGFAYSVTVGVGEKIRRLMEKEGFEIDKFVPAPGAEGMVIPFGSITGKYDLIVYVANMATKSNQTTVRIEWALPMGADVPIYMSSVPTIFISLENPYHLLDVPRVKTFINCYSSSELTIQALVEKLMGRSEFKGTSPVDAFCGKWDTRL